MSTWAVVAAAGSGTRMGAQGNKTLLRIAGVPGICRAITALRVVCDGIVLVTKPEERRTFEEALLQAGLSVDAFAAGGDTRQRSVRNALSLLPKDCDVVLVHDGARCLVTSRLVQRVAMATMQYGSAIPALPVTDTIKEIRQDMPARTLNRQELRAVQTPQGFRTADLLTAYRMAGDEEFTDDAAVLEHGGMPIHLMEGERTNIKLTAPDDLALAEAIVRVGETRVGIGYDVHRLTEGRPLILCGVLIPFKLGLLGHSDADVGTHAVIDALLGGAALGDIGSHFPDTDPVFHGADSIALLRETVRLLALHGFSVCNVDVTLVAQEPKLAPFISAMRNCLAHACRLPTWRVSVKAKTTEGLSFEGRGEGISAYATAMVRSLDMA